jgi:hypothetical protein
LETFVLGAAFQNRETSSTTTPMKTIGKTPVSPERMMQKIDIQNSKGYTSSNNALTDGRNASPLRASLFFRSIFPF